MPSVPNPKRRLSEAESDQVLRRAIDLDSARSTGNTVEELQRVAAELGVAPEALAQALGELDVDSTEVSPAPDSAASLNSSIPSFRNFLIFAVAFAVGIWVGEVNETMTGLLFIATAGLGLLYKHHGRTASYLKEMATLWLGFGFGWFIASAFEVQPDTTFHLLVPGLAGMAIGWLLQRIRWSGEKNAEPQVRKDLP